MEIYKWKWMVLGPLGFMNNVDVEQKANDIVLDLIIICQNLRHAQVTFKITVLVLIFL